CRWCGLPIDQPEALTAKEAEGGMFSDGFACADPVSEVWCLPCAWLKSGQPPHTYRMWTVLYREDRPAEPSHEKASALLAVPGLHLAGRNDLRAIVDALLDPPAGAWFCSLAESGQIHTLPFARVQTGRDRWTVRMDRDDISATVAEFRHAIHHVASLYAATFTQDEIREATPRAHTLLRVGKDRGGVRAAVALFDRHARPLARIAGGPLVDLCLF